MSQPPRRDLLYTKEIKALVRDTYHAVASPAGAVARKLYPAEELAQVPQIAIDGALGVASPLRHADIEPGDTVLDLGCGYGIDTILAAETAQPAGVNGGPQAAGEETRGSLADRIRALQSRASRLSPAQ